MTSLTWTSSINLSSVGKFEPFCFKVLVKRAYGASKSDEVDRILSNVFTQYRKEVHPATNRVDGAVEVGLSIIPLFIDIVSENIFVFWRGIT